MRTPRASFVTAMALGLSIAGTLAGCSLDRSGFIFPGPGRDAGIDANPPLDGGPDEDAGDAGDERDAGDGGTLIEVDGGVLGVDLFVGGTFSRSTEGSYLTRAPTDGATAFLAWAAVNQRRLENRGDGLGSMLLLEGGRTNLVADSRDPRGSRWTPGSAETISYGVVTGPDGELTTRSQVDALGYSTYQNQAVRVGRTYAASAYVRGSSAAISHQYFTSNPDRPLVTALGTTWVRLVNTVVATNPAIGIIPIDARNWSGIGGQVATPQDAAFDLVQLEEGGFASSPIRSVGGAATRAPETLSFATGEYPAGFLTTGFQIVVALDCTSAELVVGGYDMRLVQVGADGYVRVRAVGGEAVVELVAAGAVVASRTVGLATRGLRLTIVAQPSIGALSVTGATTGDGASTGVGTAWTARTLHVGADDVGGNPLFGRLGQFVLAR